MSDPSPRRVRDLVGRFPGSRILVLGDLMLDTFVRGDVVRISPEAPVPVVRVRSRDDHLGGAGNVAANLRAFGAEVELVSLVGDDEAGERVRASLAELGASVEGVTSLVRRPTTVKTRILAQHQQVVRIDAEEDGVLSEEEVAALRTAVIDRLDAVRAVLVSDYAKGVVDERLLGDVLPEARRRGLTVAVDPKVPHMAAYHPATVITPNQAEAARATAIRIRDEDDARRAVEALLASLDVEAVLMTRGERGMLLGRRDGEPLSIPTVAREVFDVTGAGDTVIAVLTLALCAGASPATAAVLANQAAGIVVGKLGTATCGAGELLDAMAPGEGPS